jgi:hypothetical protein
MTCRLSSPSSPPSQVKIHVHILRLPPPLAPWTLTTLITGCNHHDVSIVIVQNNFPTMGQNRSLRILSANSRHVLATRPHTPRLHATYLPAVSLQQMVLFGQNPSQGTLLKASQFLSGTHRTRQRHAETLTQSRRSPPRGTTSPTGTSCTRAR